MIRKLGCKYVRAVEQISESVGLATSWLTGLLVLVVCYDVFTRYLLQNSLVAVQEMQWHWFRVHAQARSTRKSGRLLQPIFAEVQGVREFLRLPLLSDPLLPGRHLGSENVRQDILPNCRDES